jgi:hypothetical protein
MAGLTCSLSKPLPFSPSVQSLSHMVQIDDEVPHLTILAEVFPPLYIEVIRRPHNDSVSAQSY